MGKDIIDVIADQSDRERSQDLTGIIANEQRHIVRSAIERECLDWAGELLNDRDIDGAIKVLFAGARRVKRLEPT